MAVTVKIFTKYSGRPTLFQTREFDALPVTLGRDASCTVALEDPLKHISRVHVELAEADGACWLSVVSKVNPVMVKGRRHGPGSRVMLQSGDSFDMGEFEVQVLLTEKKRAPAPPKPSLIEMLGSDEPPEMPRLQDVPPPEPGIFDEPTFVGGEEPTYMGPAITPSAPARPKTGLETTVPPGFGAPQPKPASVKPSAAVPALMKDALRVFFEGGGLPQKDLTPEQSERLLAEGAAMLRAAVEGLVTLLAARSEMHKEFAVGERDGNPLLQAGAGPSVLELLFDTALRGESPSGVKAIMDGAQDLRAHELALMAGMRSAILGAIRRFDPQVLEKAFEKSLGGFSLGGRKAKMWELFVVYQQKLAQDAQEDFNRTFGRDFLAAYQSQLRRFKTSA